MTVIGSSGFKPNQCDMNDEIAFSGRIKFTPPEGHQQSQLDSTSQSRPSPHCTHKLRCSHTAGKTMILSII